MSMTLGQFTERERLGLKHSGNNFHQIHIGCVTEVSLLLQETRELMGNSLVLSAREVPFRALDCCIGQGMQS